MTTLELLQKTRAAMGSIAAAGAEKKNALLLAMADSLEARCAEILAANAEDMAAARGRITDVMLDRLKLDENRIAGFFNDTPATEIYTHASTTLFRSSC